MDTDEYLFSKIGVNMTIDRYEDVTTKNNSDKANLIF
jgi:hypothetical protein